ncbi:MAG: hypothetical protein ACFCVD_17700 [Nodosilinea sp.]
MASFKAALLRILLGLALWVWLWAAPPTLAQTQNALPAPAPPSGGPVMPAPPASDASTPSTASLQESVNSRPDSTPPRAEHTYQQPPDPYDMEAIEAYDQEVYGEGR